MVKIEKDSFGAFYDGTPGKTWDDYAARLKNAAAGEVDERGYSLADHILRVDEAQTCSRGAGPKSQHVRMSSNDALKLTIHSASSN